MKITCYFIDVNVYLPKIIAKDSIFFFLLFVFKINFFIHVAVFTFKLNWRRLHARSAQSVSREIFTQIVWTQQIWPSCYHTVAYIILEWHHRWLRVHEHVILVKVTGSESLKVNQCEFGPNTQKVQNTTTTTTKTRQKQMSGLAPNVIFRRFSPFNLSLIHISEPTRPP